MTSLCSRCFWEPHLITDKKNEARRGDVPPLRSHIPAMSLQKHILEHATCKTLARYVFLPHSSFNQGLRGHLCLAETGLSLWKCLAHALRVLRAAPGLLPGTGQFPHDQPYQPHPPWPWVHPSLGILPYPRSWLYVPVCLPTLQTLGLFTVRTHWGRSWGGPTLGPWAFLPCFTAHWPLSSGQLWSLRALSLAPEPVLLSNLHGRSEAPGN